MACVLKATCQVESGQRPDKVMIFPESKGGHISKTRYLKGKIRGDREIFWCGRMDT